MLPASTTAGVSLKKTKPTNGASASSKKVTSPKSGKTTSRKPPKKTTTTTTSSATGQIQQQMASPKSARKNVQASIEFDEPELEDEIVDDDVPLKPEKKPQKITFSLLSNRILKEEKYEASTPEDIAEYIMSIHKVRLDNENIGDMDGLDLISSNCTHLYLHNNMISQIEGLDFFMQLTLLSLSHNRITNIEHIDHLPKLRALNICYNFIDTIHSDALPKSLWYLNAAGNPMGIENNVQARRSLFEALPQLKSIDEITREEDNEEKEDNEEEEEKEEEEEDNEEEGQGGNEDIVDNIRPMGDLSVSLSLAFDDVRNQLHQHKLQLAKRIHDSRKEEDENSVAEEMKTSLDVQRHCTAHPSFAPVIAEIVNSHRKTMNHLRKSVEALGDKAAQLIPRTPIAADLEPKHP